MLLVIYIVGSQRLLEFERSVCFFRFFVLNMNEGWNGAKDNENSLRATHLSLSNVVVRSFQLKYIRPSEVSA